jgi:glycosyltransferase involved in cell wall biosynthesis
LWQRHDAAFQRATLWGGGTPDEGVAVDRPSKFLLRQTRSRRLDGAVLRGHAQRLRAQVKGSAEYICYVWDASLWPLVEYLAPRYLVYHAYDAFHLTEHWSDERTEWQRLLVERADLLIATSKSMVDGYSEETRTLVRELPNGVDLELFTRRQREPDDLQRIPHPRIGYVGALNHKVDVRVIVEIARARPDWHWVLVGPDVSSAQCNADWLRDWHACLAQPNVHALGARPHESVPGYVQAMDVNTLCYRAEGAGWWVHGDPLKMYEALAVGRPVIGVPIERIAAFGHVIDLAATTDEWIAAIERALTSGGVGTLAQRRAAASQNTWNSRVDQLDGWLRAMTADSGKTRDGEGEIA